MNWAAVLGLLIAIPTAATAAAGISDYFSTQACWVRKPFALVKVQSDGGRYPAKLVRAREWADGDRDVFSGGPISYGEIVPVETVVEEIESLVVGPRFLTLQLRSGNVTVVDMDDAGAASKQFPTLIGANQFLAEHGDELAEIDFRSFESVYAEFGPKRHWLIFVAMGFVPVVVAGLLWTWRRRRYPRKPHPPAGSG